MVAKEADYPPRSPGKTDEIATLASIARIKFAEDDLLFHSRLLQ